jgi:hypothetical protein
MEAMTTVDAQPASTPDPAEVALILASRLAAWAAIVAVGSAARMMDASTEERRHATDVGRSVASNAAGAVVTVVVEAQRGAADTVSVAVERVRPLAGIFDALRGPVERLIETPRAAAERSAVRLAERWDAGVSFAVREVLRHVDLDEVAAGINVDAVVEKVDFDKVLERLDLDGIVSRVDLERVIDRIDIDAIVERVNVDPIVDRVDAERLVQRIDLNAIARQVLDDLEIAALLRDSTGSLSVETVDALRERGLDADQRFARFIDALLRRREGRETTLMLADDADRSRP